MMKSRILGLVAALVAITGQAAELPTLAEATEDSRMIGRPIFAMAGRDT